MDVKKDDLLEKLTLNEEDNFCIDELFTEIYWTVFVYSLWKIEYKKDEIPAERETRFHGALRLVVAAAHS